MEEKTQKKKHIGFWIAFPIGFLLIAALLIFYFDLANGPIIVFILALLCLVALAVTSILLINKKKRWRLIPWGAFILSMATLLPLARPSVEVFPAVTHSNVVKVENTLKLRDGLVQGVYSEDGQVEVYAGIPYAAPPIGERRWKEPIDPTPWEGVRDCSVFAPRSMQPISNSVTDSLVDMYAEKGWHPDYAMHPLQNMSEDSLYLNVWRPKNAENLPILVYIHGGSLTKGSSASPDINGEAMAHKGLIMITVQYRLGVFGYFAHPDLITESPNATTGNYGLLDQIKALEWVKENASYFGGDPNNVTVAGESAGSSSVSALCISPLAHGLFQRAIGESSSIVLERAPHTMRPLEDALSTGKKIMQEQGCSSLKELRDVSAEKLVKTAFSNSSMTFDGYALSKTKTPKEIYEAKENNETALLNGYNVKEADAFIVPQYLLSPTNKDNILGRLETVFGKNIAKKIYDLYLPKIEKDAFTAFNEIISVYWFIHPHHRWSSIAAENGVDVYRYQFTKENGYLGTYHSGEIAYAYGNLKRTGHDFAYDQSDAQLSNAMVDYWSAFAKTGNPNSGELLGKENWGLYKTVGDYIMEFGSRVGRMDDAYAGLYPIIDEYIASKQPN
ncbi:MAG: carboxylesterase family protein [Erysipelotrichaceae bacterium]|nr:carboxylesterase family protein [Erysipelotrichaceae bacterium]